MSSQSEKAKKPSVKAQNLSSRLSAVQALYQAMQNDQPVKDVAKEFIDRRLDMEIDGEKLVKADPATLSRILSGVDERFEELEVIVSAHFHKDSPDKNKKIEPLLKAVLLCGSYELLAHQDIDSAVIINDYLNVAHAFYEQGEVNLINAILDAISKVLRS